MVDIAIDGENDLTVYIFSNDVGIFKEADGGLIFDVVHRRQHRYLFRIVDTIQSDSQAEGPAEMPNEEVLDLS